MRDAAGVDDCQLGPIAGFDLLQSEAFEQLPNLLALVLIDFAAKSIDGKSFHDMIRYGR